MRANTSRKQLEGLVAASTHAPVEEALHRDQVEQRLTLFKIVFDNASEALIITDAEQRILEVNGWFTQITGYTAAEVIGEKPSRLASGRHDDAFYEAMWTSIRETGRWEGEIWDRRANGEIYPKHLSIFSVHDNEGRVLNYVGSFTDITPRKQLEEETLRLATHDPLTGLPNRRMMVDRLDQAIRQAVRSGQMVALMFIDLDRFRTINDSLGHLLGDKLLCRIAARLQRCVRDSDTVARLGGDEFVLVLPEVASPDGVIRVALSLIQAMAEPMTINGHTVTVSVSIGVAFFPHDAKNAFDLLHKADSALYQARAAGRSTYCFFSPDMTRRLADTLEMRVIEEVAAREEAQKRLAHAERMQALGRLASGIAHDFNNILQVIEGGATLIEQRPSDTEKVSRFAQMMLEATNRGSTITRRLLAFARSDELRCEAADTNALLESLGIFLKHTLDAAISVQIALTPNLPPLLADKGQLETVLINLATNARDAMPNGGTLTLAAMGEAIPSVEGSRADLPPGRYVRLSVVDTGSGMDADTLEHAGEPFFTSKALGQGTGLGLAMARGFAEQSGGALTIDSAPGMGTTVTLWLPEATMQPMEPECPAKAASCCTPPVTRPQVLLVDDNAMVRDILAENMRNGGYAVLAVESGTEALEVLKAGEAVEILITDLSMPGIDGLSLIRQVQALQPKLPAVLLTGDPGDDAALAEKGAVPGAFSLLRKPVSSRQLLDRLSATLAFHAENRH